MSETLLPCPFCGAQAEHIHVYPGEAVVRCVESCVGFTAETAQEAVAKWNRRNPPMLAPTTQSAAAWKEGYEYGLSIGRKDPATQEAVYMRGYKGAQAVSQMLLEAARDALYASAKLFPDEMTDWRLKMVQKTLRNINSAIANGIGADVAQVYAAGWRKCAKWADRADLVADIGSPAYERDRLQAMAKLGGEQ